VDLHRPAINADHGPLRGPTGQGVPGGGPGSAPGRQGERTGLGGAVGEALRVAGEQQLERDTSGEEEDRDPRDDLYRCLTRATGNE